MEVRDYLQLAKRRGWIVILVAVVAAVSAYAFCRLQTPLYRSTMQLTVLPARADLGLTQSTKTLIATYNSVVFSRRNAAEVVSELNLDYTPETLLGNTRIGEEAANNGVRIEVTDYDGDVANRISYQWSLIYKKFRDEDNARQRREDRVDVYIGDPPNYAKVWPQTGVITAGAGVLGLLVGGLIAGILEWSQANVIRTKADIERKLSLAVIGAIPSE